MSSNPLDPAKNIERLRDFKPQEPPADLVKEFFEQEHPTPSGEPVGPLPEGGVPKYPVGILSGWQPAPGIEQLPNWDRLTSGEKWFGLTGTPAIGGVVETLKKYIPDIPIVGPAFTNAFNWLFDVTEEGLEKAAG